ncbi:MAG TPA: GNAT family N-acetyltransferase, partial [Candidatus Acidoferrales bacterium]|nr:GNAT family N-acetyltransferase [Candidatus Acidoferrales bacterium]
ENELIGCAGLLKAATAAEYDPSLVGAVEVLAALLPAFWGRGYANEALGVAIGYAFESLGLQQLAAVTDVPNQASERMVRRLGFVQTGECPGPRYRIRTHRLSQPDFVMSRAARIAVDEPNGS